MLSLIFFLLHLPDEDYSNQTEALTAAATNVTAVTSGLAYNHSTVPGTVYPPTTHTTRKLDEVIFCSSALC